MRSIEERLTDLEAETFAQTTVIAAIMGAMFSPAAAAAIRERCCEVVEGLYGEGERVKHDALQRILHQVEDLFRGAEAFRGAMPQTD